MDEVWGEIINDKMLVKSIPKLVSSWRCPDACKIQANVNKNSKKSKDLYAVPKYAKMHPRNWIVLPKYEQTHPKRWPSGQDPMQKCGCSILFTKLVSLVKHCDKPPRLEPKKQLNLEGKTNEL